MQDFLEPIVEIREDGEVEVFRFGYFDWLDLMADCDYATGLTKCDLTCGDCNYEVCPGNKMTRDSS